MLRILVLRSEIWKMKCLGCLDGMARRERAAPSGGPSRQLVESHPAACQHSQNRDQSLHSHQDVDQARPGGLAGVGPPALLPVAGAGLAPPAHLLRPPAGGQQAEAEAGE